MARHPVLGTAALLGATFLWTSCGSGVGNAAPSVSAIPAQTVAGGATFSLDLSGYVSDRETGPLAYTVVSGGGSFSGSTYSNVFDSLGTYTVQFKVSDSQGKDVVGSFTVRVTSADLAVVTEGTSLLLLDTDTEKMTTVSAASGLTYKTHLTKGHIVYEASGTTTSLRVYDPNTGVTTVIDSSPDYHTTYAAKTSDGRIVYLRTQVADSSDTDLFLWNSETGAVKEISAEDGVADGSPVVSTTNLVYYQRDTPPDVWYYDPTDDASYVVANGPTAERTVAATADGSVLLSRVGGGGELDLMHHNETDGLVEVGADLGATILAQTKTYKGHTSSTSNSRVVFEVTGATSIDLYVWDPATGASRAIATNGVDDTFAAVTPLDEIVYVTETGTTDHDISIYTWSTNASRAISPVDSTNDVYEGVLSNGDVVIRRETGTGDDLHLYDTSGSSLAALATTGSDDYVFNAVLANDKVAYTRQGGSGGVFVVNTSGAPSPVTVGGPGSTYAGETSGGDFVVQTTVSMQTDLVLWDESATAVVTISNTAGDDAFASRTNSDGKVLFTRVVTGQTNTDLFIWDPSDTSTVRLTETTLNHGVVAAFTASNP